MSADWNNKTVAELKKACAEKGLEGTGRKVELVERLAAYDQEHDAGGGQEEEAEPHEEEEEEEEEHLDYEDTHDEEEAEQHDGAGYEDVGESENLDEGDQEAGEEHLDEDEEKDEGQEAKEDEQMEVETKEEGESKDDKKVDENSENMGTKLSYQPRQNDFINCQSNWQRLRTLVVGPLSHEESLSPMVQDLISRAEKSEVSYLHTQEKALKMWAKIHFYTIAEAKEAQEQMTNSFPESKSMIMPKKPLTSKSRSVFWLRDLVLGNQEPKDKDTPATIFIDNIPPTIKSEADLVQHFPGAKEVFLAWTKEESHLGYAFVTYQSKEKTKILVEGLKAKAPDVDGCKLRVMMYMPGARIPGEEKSKSKDEKPSEHKKDGEEKRELKADAQGNFTVMYEKPSSDYDIKQAKEEFAKYGPVSDVNLTRSGYVFVRYKQRSCASKALKALESKLGVRPALPGKRDSRIKDHAQTRKRTGSPTQHRGQDKMPRMDSRDELHQDANGNYTVYFRKPNSNYSKEQARRNFSEFGNVVEVHESRSGAMFVRYKERFPAVKAIRVLGEKLGVRPAPPGKKDILGMARHTGRQSRERGGIERANVAPGIMGMNPMMAGMRGMLGGNVPSLFDIEPPSGGGMPMNMMTSNMQMQQQQLQQQQLLQQQQQLLQQQQQQQQPAGDMQTASTVSLLMGISKMLGKLNKTRSRSRSQSRSRSRSPPPQAYASSKQRYSSHSSSTPHSLMGKPPGLSSGQQQFQTFRSREPQQYGSRSSQFIDQTQFLEEDSAYGLYN